MHRQAGRHTSRRAGTSAPPPTSTASSSSRWYEGPRPPQQDRTPTTSADAWGQLPATAASAKLLETPRRPAPRASEAAPGPSGSGSGSFAALHDHLLKGQASSFVIRSEAWLKLFDLVRTPGDADAAFALLLRDAAVREANNWDFVTHGYGQTIFQLVKAAGAVGAYHTCDAVLSHAEQLHLTVGNDTVPNMMRKLAATDAEEAELERLYGVERTLRGKNTSAGFYELSRVYRRGRRVEKLRALLAGAQAQGVALKPHILKDTQDWLKKH